MFTYNRFLIQSIYLVKLAVATLECLMLNSHGTTMAMITKLSLQGQLCMLMQQVSVNESLHYDPTVCSQLRVQ